MHQQTPENKKNNFAYVLYRDHYKKLMIMSFILLILSVAAIGYKVITTGDFVDRGITLKGGLILTTDTEELVNPDSLKAELMKDHPRADIIVRDYSSFGTYGLVVEASGLTADELVQSLKSKVAIDEDYSLEIVGPSLGAAFFNQTLKALFVAFLFMSLVIFMYFGESLKLKWLTAGLSIIAGIMMFYADSFILYLIPLLIMAALLVIYYRSSIPSFGIILCAISDIFFALAIFNLVGLKLNTAGVAAFLMLVGYSIDTDILLSVRVLKRKEGTVFDRVIGALKTGMMMSLSALIAVLSAYFFSNSSVIKEIMFVLAVGLFGDIIFTWIQNAGILRAYIERKHKQHH